MMSKVLKKDDWFFHVIVHPASLCLSAPQKNKNIVLPYFGKRKQETYHLNLSYWCFHTLPSVFFFQAKFCTSKVILLRDMLGKTSWYSIDVIGNDRHILLFYKKFHCCQLLPFAKVGQYTPHRPMGVNPRVVSFDQGWGCGIVQWMDHPTNLREHLE